MSIPFPNDDCFLSIRISSTKSLGKEYIKKLLDSVTRFSTFINIYRRQKSIRLLSFLAIKYPFSTLTVFYCQIYFDKYRSGFFRKFKLLSFNEFLINFY